MRVRMYTLYLETKEFFFNTCLEFSLVSLLFLYLVVFFIFISNQTNSHLFFFFLNEIDHKFFFHYFLNPSI